MKIIRKIVDQLHQLMVQIGKVLLVLMTVITCIQVFSRYVMDKSIRWSEEVPLILMVWFGFISLAIGVKKKLHISIELFYKMFPVSVQKVLDKVVHLSILIFGLIMVYYGFKLSMVMMKSTMPATKMPTGYLYGIIPISGIFVIYDSLLGLFGLGEEITEETEVSEAMKNLSLGGKN